jgi:antitoxin FitA
MATLLARDIDEELVRLLKQQAKAHNRSAEAEHRAILESALRSGKDAFIARARRMVEATKGRNLADSADLIREDRDRDHAP